MTYASTNPLSGVSREEQRDMLREAFRTPVSMGALLFDMTSWGVGGNAKDLLPLGYTPRRPGTTTRPTEADLDYWEEAHLKMLRANIAKAGALLETATADVAIAQEELLPTVNRLRSATPPLQPSRR